MRNIRLMRVSTVFENLIMSRIEISITHGNQTQIISLLHKSTTRSKLNLKLFTNLEKAKKRQSFCEQATSAYSATLPYLQKCVRSQSENDIQNRALIYLYLYHLYSRHFCVATLFPRSCLLKKAVL